MAWGGARVGAGKKPRPKPVLVADGRSEDEVREDLEMPPADIHPDGQAFWRDYAPLAFERKTLTEATVPAFRLLCELHAKKMMVSVMVDKGALGGLRVYMQLAKQVETLMARFCLAPFGKSAGPEKVKPKVNPFGAFGTNFPTTR